MVISCSVSKIKRAIGRNFYTTFYITSLGEMVANIFTLFFSQPSQIPGLLGGANKILQKVLCLLTVHAHYRRTDRQTDGNAISIVESSLR